MSFLSPQFFLFFPLVVLVYFLLPQRARNLWLLLASWFFYLCAGPVFFVYLLTALLLTYFGALLMRGRAKSTRRGILATLLVILFGALFLFKYLAFAFTLLERALSAAGLAFTSPALDLILPAGISFYLFMAAGYLVDVYREKTPAQTNFIRLALFLSFFPYLISGPIGRAGDILPQLEEKHPFSYDRLRSGLLRFLWGAFKKLVIADRLGVLVSTVYASPASFGRLQVIAAACAFSVQIYCDFSAYSDMALGVGEAMGFTFMENFRTPYFSRSIAGFWRTWHISLSSWFRDYLYIPLGGSRKGRGRKYLNILIVFAVSGLWHGAATSFVVWGLLNGLYQVIGDLTASLRARCRRGLRLSDDSSLTALWQMLVTFLLATVAWVFFKAGSFTHSLEIFRAMCAGPWLTRPISAWGLGLKELLAAAAAFLMLLAVDIPAYRRAPDALPLHRRYLTWKRPVRWIAALALLMIVLIFGVYGTGYDAQDFIYFKF